MKRIVIIHGWDGNPHEPMIDWLKEELEKEGNEVIAPAMPNPEEPIIKDWVIAVLTTSQIDKDTVLVGHSVGCQAVLRAMEMMPEHTLVGGAILIAPWMELDSNTIEEEGEEIVEIARPWMETPINFEKIKQHAGNFFAIFSDNDPYVSVSQKDFFEKVLDTKTVLLHNYGHFAPQDNVKEVPDILEIIKKLI